MPFILGCLPAAIYFFTINAEMWKKGILRQTPRGIDYVDIDNRARIALPPAPPPTRQKQMADAVLVPAVWVDQVADSADP